MFGISKTTWLKKTIFEILDKQSDFMTTAELTEKLGMASLETVKKICREIKKECDQIYHPDEVEFIIHKNHGVRMLRHANNAQHYSAYIYSQELVYALFTTTFFKPVTYTEAFCEEQHVSASSVRRKIKEMNANFENYGIQFSIANEIKVHGAAQHIRCAAAFFGYTAHRQLSAIPSLDDPTSYLTKTKEIGRYLGCHWTDNNVETFAILVFATECSRAQAQTIVYEAYAQNMMSQLAFPKKPAFLNDWHEDDWQTFLLALDVFCLYDFSDLLHYEAVALPPDEAFHAKAFCTALSDWFVPLDAAHELMAHKQFIRFFLMPQLLKVDQKIMLTFNPLDFNYLEAQFPTYLKRFDKAFAQFTAQYPSYQQERYYYEALFTLSTKLLPLATFKPTIYMYHYSDFSLLHRQITRQFIEAHFSNRFTIQFVERIEDCDIVIGDVYYTGELKKPFVLMRIHLYANDLMQIENQVAEIVQQRVEHIEKSELP